MFCVNNTAKKMNSFTRSAEHVVFKSKPGESMNSFCQQKASKERRCLQVVGNSGDLKRKVAIAFMIL